MPLKLPILNRRFRLNRSCTRKLGCSGNRRSSIRRICNYWRKHRRHGCSDAELTNGKVTHSPELKRRVDSFRKFWDGKYGDVIIQTNVEDQRLGIDAYALSQTRSKHHRAQMGARRQSHRRRSTPKRYCRKQSC